MSVNRSALRRGVAPPAAEKAAHVRAGLLFEKTPVDLATAPLLRQSTSARASVEVPSTRRMPRANVGFTVRSILTAQRGPDKWKASRDICQELCLKLGRKGNGTRLAQGGIESLAEAGGRVELAEPRGANERVEERRNLHPARGARAVVVLASDFAQSTPATFVSFAAFMAGVETADAASYLGAAAKVESAAAFEAMRNHILSLYEGVTPTNSFLLGSQYVDCVPILQQPTARTLGLPR